jgi:hypothetical protein
MHRIYYQGQTWAKELRFCCWCSGLTRILWTLKSWLCVKCMNEGDSLFDFDYLPFEPYLHKHHVFLPFSSSKHQKAADFSNVAFWKKKKDWTITHEKCPLLEDMDLVVKEITNITSIFTWRKVCSLSTRCYQRCRVWWISYRHWRHRRGSV